MSKYKVVETCTATVRTTYTVEADSPEEAEVLVRCGNTEPDDEEVYDHQSAEYETTPTEEP